MSGRRVPRTYRLLLGLLPGDFRKEYGADMGVLFAERRAEAGNSAGARVGVWLLGIRDLLRHAAAERWSGGAGSSKTPGLWLPGRTF